MKQHFLSTMLLMVFGVPIAYSQLIPQQNKSSGIRQIQPDYQPPHHFFSTNSEQFTFYTDSSDQKRYVMFNNATETGKSSSTKFIIKLKDEFGPNENVDVRQYRQNLRERIKQQHDRFKDDFAMIQNGHVIARMPSSATKIRHEFSRAFNGFAIEGDESLKQKIRQLTYVAYVVEDRQVKATDISSSRLIRADEAWTHYNTTGKNVDIAIIDTGIDYLHVDLGGGYGEGFKVKGGYDFVNDDPDPMDDNSHGTHVAGIAAGNGPGLKGVAPDANLYAYKVLDAAGYGHVSDIIAAVERTLDPNQDGNTDDKLDVVNMSLGATATAEDPMAEAVNNAVNAGVTFVVSAGNNWEHMSIGSPGIAEKAITIAATDSLDLTATFSSKGPNPFTYSMKPDVAAPGVDIYSSIPGNQYARYSGTSMAAPHVAGAVALLLERHPHFSPEVIKGVLMSSADRTNAESIWHQGAGRIDLMKAMDVSFTFAPGSISLGRLDPTAPTWVTTRTIKLINLADSAQEIALSAAGDSVGSGVEITFGTSLVTIPANSSAYVDVTFTISVGQLPFRSYPEAYTGSIIGTSPHQSLKINYAFLHSNARRLKLTGELPFWVFVVGKENHFYRAFTPAPDMEILVPEGIYDVVSPYTDLHFVFHQDITHADTAAIIIDKAQAKNQVTFDPKDENSDAVTENDNSYACAAIGGKEKAIAFWIIRPSKQIHISDVSGYGVDYKLTHRPTTDRLKLYDISLSSGAGIGGNVTLSNDGGGFSTITFTNPSIPKNAVQLATSMIRATRGITLTKNPPDTVMNPLTVYASRHEEMYMRGSAIRFSPPDTARIPWETAVYNAMSDNSIRFSDFYGEYPDTLKNTTDLNYTLGHTLPRVNAQLFIQPDYLVFHSWPHNGFINYGYGDRSLGPIEYEILSGDSIYRRGTTRNESLTEWGNYRVEMQIPPNVNRFRFSYPEHYLNETKGVMDVDYTFDMSHYPRSNPPYVRHLLMESNGKNSNTFTINDDIQVNIGLTACYVCGNDVHGTDSAMMYFRSSTDLDWKAMNMTRVSGNTFRAEFDSVLAVGFYDLKLFAFDEFDNTTQYEIKPAFRITPASSILLISPENEATDVAALVNLKWVSDNHLVTSFQVEVSSNLSFTNIVYSDTVTNIEAWVLLEPGKTYYWRVRPSGDTLTAAQTFSFAVAVPTITLISPAEEEAGVSIPATFRWRSVKHCDNYELIVTADSLMQVPVFTATVNDTAMAVYELEYSTRYFWKVGARFADTVIWSETRRFMIGDREVHLISPENNALQELTTPFSWYQKDANSFVFQLSTNPAFDILVADRTISGDSIVIDSLRPATRYHWRVRENSDPHSWSEVYTFTTVTPYVELISPHTDASSVACPCTFIWRSVPAKNAFRFELATDSLFTNPFLTSVLSDTVATVEDLDFLTAYYWRVASVWDDTLFYSGTRAFVTADEHVDPVTPWHDAMNQPQSVTFVWRGQGSGPYVFQIASDFDFTDILTDEIVHGDTIVVDGLEPAASYWWRVRSAKDGSGWSSRFRFFTQGSLVTLLSPADRLSGVGVMYSYFSWSYHAEADRFIVRLAEDSTFQTAPIIFELTAKSTYFDGLAYSTTYYWQVGALTGTDTVWSQVNRFTTETGTKIYLIAPENNAVVPLDVQLKWHAHGFERFHLQISHSVFFDSMLRDTIVSSPGLMIRNLRPGSSYFWRVKAANYAAQWSETSRFDAMHINVPLHAPENLSIQMDQPVRFSWQTVPGSPHYDLYIATDSLFNSSLQIHQTSDTAFSVDGLAYGTLFFWKVQGHINGHTITSRIRSFTTGSPAVTLISPENNSVDQPMSTAFSWAAADEPSFVFQISTDEDFADDQEIAVSTNSHALDLLPSTTYFWRVRVSYGTTWSDTYKFTTLTPTIVLIEPVMQEANSSMISVHFSWIAQNNVSDYTLAVSSEEDFVSAISATTTATSLTMDSLATATTYYWKVGANFSNTTIWSRTASFVTDHVVAAETLQTAKTRVFPNPTSGTLNITIYSPMAEAAAIEIINPFGQRIFYQSLGNIQGEMTVEVSLGKENEFGIPNGLYLVLINTGSVVTPVRTILVR